MKKVELTKAIHQAHLMMGTMAIKTSELRDPDTPRMLEGYIKDLDLLCTSLDEKLTVAITDEKDGPLYFSKHFAALEGLESLYRQVLEIHGAVAALYQYNIGDASEVVK